MLNRAWVPFKILLIYQVLNSQESLRHIQNFLSPCVCMEFWVVLLKFEIMIRLTGATLEASSLGSCQNSPSLFPPVAYVWEARMMSKKFLLANLLFSLPPCSYPAANPFTCIFPNFRHLVSFNVWLLLHFCTTQCDLHNEIVKVHHLLSLWSFLTISTHWTPFSHELPEKNIWSSQRGKHSSKLFIRFERNTQAVAISINAKSVA